MVIKKIKKNILITGRNSQLANSIKLNKSFVKYFQFNFLIKKN